MLRVNFFSTPTAAIFSSVLTLACAIAASFPSGAVWAAEPTAWEEAVREAIEHHPDLAAAREDVNRAKADRTTAASGLWPSVSADVSAGTSETRTAGSRATDSFAYGISGSQLIFDGFKSIYEVRTAVALIDAAGYAYRVASSDVRFNLRQAYVNLWRAQQLIDITSRITARRQESRDLIQLRYEAGREHRGSLLTSEANLAEARFEEQRARRALATAQRALGNEMGRRTFEPMTVPEAIDSGDPTDSRAASDPSPEPAAGPGPAAKPDFEQLAAENPFLLQLVVLKEAARWGVRSAQADFFPAVYADASLGKRGSRWAPDTTAWSAGASASVNVFDGWARWAGVDRAESDRRSAEAQEVSGRNGVLLTLEETWADWQDAVGTREVRRLFFEAAQERAQIAEAEYGTGLITFNDWIIIENNLVLADKAYLDARAGVLTAEARWRQAKGETLDE